MKMKTQLEKIRNWGIETVRAEKRAITIIEKLGWTPTNEGLWLAPREYENHYLAGTKTNAIVALFIERTIIKGIQSDITKAAEVFT